MSYSVWSLDDTMNEHSELPSIFCQVHHSWQLCLSPICDIIQPLPSLPALPAGPRHWSEHYVLFHGWVTYYVTKVLQFPRLEIQGAERTLPFPRHDAIWSPQTAVIARRFSRDDDDERRNEQFTR